MCFVFAICVCMCFVCDLCVSVCVCDSVCVHFVCVRMQRFFYFVYVYLCPFFVCYMSFCVLACSCSMYIDLLLGLLDSEFKFTFL